MSSTTALVQADAVEVTYSGGIRAIETASFAIPTGQFVALVGPSGCGKSTLLRAIAGLLEPSGGQLQVAGLAPLAARRQALRVSFVFQDATLLPWRTVEANVALPLELAHTGRTERRERTRQAVQMVGLEEFGRRYPTELSGGMRMRVSLARALVTGPQLLLLDEPFAALDDITRQRLNEELLALWAEHRWTALFVTHNIAESVFLSQRVLVMARRPSRILADVAVPFAGERTSALRARADFAALTGQIADLLREGSE